MEHTKTKGCLDSLTLKLLAMALMLCDHLWATVLPGVMWLTAVGRICAMPTVSCPPAIPIVVSGERIGPAALKLFARYGIKNVAVLK